jgi:tetratricopeptide (TPR) repeat protein
MPLRNLGRHDEALASLNKGLEIDPLNSTLIKNVSDHESRYGNFERAEQLLLRLTKLPEPPDRSHAWLYMLYDKWNRFPEALAAAKDNVRQHLGSGQSPELEFLFLTYAKLGMTDDAEYWFAVARSQMPAGEPPVALTSLLAPLGGNRWLTEDLQAVEALVDKPGEDDLAHYLTYGGLGWIQAGDIPKGIDWLERGIAIYQHQMKPDDPPDGIDYWLLDENWPSFYSILIAERLAFAYREDGQAEKSGEALQFLREINQESEGTANPNVAESRALERFLSYDMDGAAKHLRQALDFGWANYHLVRNDRVWTGASQAPVLRKVLAAARAASEEQRKRVETADAGHDFRAEVQALLSD